MVNAHTHQIRVYIEDTDAGGIVYHSNYFKFTERARTEWIRHFGYGKHFIDTYQMMFVVRSIESTFHSSAVLDDLLTIHTSIINLAKTYIDLAQNIIRGDNDTIVETNARIVLVDCGGRWPARIPETIYNLLRKAGNL